MIRVPTTRMNHMFETQRNQLLATMDSAHDAYYRAEVLSGPSLHFHLRSLEAAHARDFDHFAEYVYAALASGGCTEWGQTVRKCVILASFGFP